MSSPAPYPATTRAKGWRFEVDMEKVKASDTWLRAKTGSMRGALLLLWAESWQQTPCGSLPDDDELLALILDMPDDEFAARKPVLMRGWWLADDGRLYHDTIAARVLEMIAQRSKEANRKAANRAKPAADSGGVPPAVPDLSRGTTAGVHPQSATGTGTGTSKKKRGDTPLKPPAWTLPGWVPAEQWGQFVEHRKAMRGVPFTDAARDGVVNEMRKLADLGHDPADLLTAAITRGWRTVYPPKASPGGGAVAGLSAAGANTARNAANLENKLFGDMP